MKNSFELSIPQPCSEKWQNFTPTDLGGFCCRCQKEVIDFTSWDEDKIKEYFKDDSQSTCGRFRSNQLKKYELTATHPPGRTNWWQISLISLTMALSTRYATALEIKKPVQEMVEKKIGEMSVGKIILKPEYVQVHGTVTTASYEGIAGVSVVLNGSTLGTITDAEGKFSLGIPNAIQTDKLSFSFVGYITEQRNITDGNFQSIILEEDRQELGGLILVKKRSWWSPRGLWYRIKNIFR